MAARTFTKGNFETEVIKAPGTVLIDFWAAWCGPCRMVGPVIDEIAEEVTDVVVGKVNVDEEPELAAAFSVSSIPALVVIRSGKVQQFTVGVKSKADILKMIGR